MRSRFNLPRIKRALVVTALAVMAPLLFLSSCTSFRVQVPEGFALAEEGEQFLAVSPEGLSFRVIRETHEPEMDVEFWSAALKRQLSDEGYRMRSEGEFFECPAGKGFFIEWNVPYQGDTWVYMTGIVPAGKIIYLAEAAAEHNLYKTCRESLVESLKSISAR